MSSSTTTRTMSKDDLEYTCGKEQLSFDGNAGQVLADMQAEIEEVIISTWACVQHAMSLGQSSQELEDLSMSYIDLTNFNNMFDLDGHFLVPIPPEIAAFAEGSQLTAPMWTPQKTAKRQLPKGRCLILSVMGYFASNEFLKAASLSAAA